MRILIVVPHYVGPSHPGNNVPTIGSYIEPLSRIAALNELIVGLHRHFGPAARNASGEAKSTRIKRLDVLILAKRGYEVLDELGLAPGTFAVEYVECDPPRLAFQVQRIFRERFGAYDFYCYMEDDLSVHDAAFFDKLTWFQQNFGRERLLQAVLYEMPATGSPIKCLVDPALPESCLAPFRRAGQPQKLEAVWNGQQQLFSLPSNPHSASFFLTEEQLAYWMEQPTFEDEDDSWIGPLESAATFSIGRVFDIYKPLEPDPFFLELGHFGTRYACQFQRDEAQFGAPPLLAIAQNAVHAALEAKQNGSSGLSLSELARDALRKGTAAELRGQLERLEANSAVERATTARTIYDLSAEITKLVALLEQEQGKQLRDVRSLRWLLRSLWTELLRRSRH